MLNSLRARLILASVLWTVGLLGLMHGGFIYLARLTFSDLHLMLWLSALVMGFGLLAARHTMKRFYQLREGLTAVRAGQRSRVEGKYPSEVQPLIDDLNALLEEREKAVQRAFASAGDLAHGLKTPLALLAQTEDPQVSEQVARMNRQVTYHLARARAAASGTAGAAPCGLAACVDGLRRTVLKLYAARALSIEVAVAEELKVRVQLQDLEEMLGNVLDNACKWGRSRVRVEAAVEGTHVFVTVDDDGPGLAAELRAKVLERGVRADEATPGSGLGLAIVRDLVEIYGGSVELSESAMGGLRVKVKLPR